MTVYLVGAGPGDPGLFTRRGADIMSRADVVVYDRLVPAELLDLAPPAALRIDVGKRPGARTRQHDINTLLVEHGRAGRLVVRLKGGDPFVFGRGGEEALALQQAGLDYEVVPGVSAALAVPAYAGVPVTHRGLATSVTVVTGRVGDDDDPSSDVDWESLATAGGTLVVLMGMERRHGIARRLMAAGRPGETPVVVSRWGTTPLQQMVRTTLSALGEVELEAPATIVIGPVAGLGLDWFSPPVLAGLTVVVTRERGRHHELRQALAGAGARVLHLPMVRTEDPSDGGAALRRAAADPGAFDWVVCTSAEAVRRLRAVVPDARALAGTRLAAVGRATAEAFGWWGMVPDLVAHPATAEGLVAGFGPGPGSVFHPGAEEGRPQLAAGLRAKGYSVEEVPAYRTVAETPPAAALHEAAHADVVTFASPSAVQAYVTAAGDRPLPPLVVCIGPVTAEAAAAAGLAVAAVSEEPGSDGLVAAVCRAVGRA